MNKLPFLIIKNFGGETLVSSFDDTMKIISSGTENNSYVFPDTSFLKKINGNQDLPVFINACNNALIIVDFIYSQEITNATSGGNLLDASQKLEIIKNNATFIHSTNVGFIPDVQIVDSAFFYKEGKNMVVTSDKEMVTRCYLKGLDCFYQFSQEDYHKYKLKGKNFLKELNSRVFNTKNID